MADTSTVCGYPFNVYTLIKPRITLFMEELVNLTLFFLYKIMLRRILTKYSTILFNEYLSERPFPQIRISLKI